MIADAQTATPTAALHTPGVGRRLACFTYEGVLLFGVLMVAGWLYSSLTQQRDAMVGRHGLQAFVFLALGIYFVWFWSHGGQTVAMKTWHIRLVARDGGPVSQARAMARYLSSWVWFVPALVGLRWAGSNDLASIFGALATGIAAYAALTRLHPSGQFWHDTACGTRLITIERPATAHR